MMHSLLERVAQFGGEGALAALFVLSIVSVGIIGQRVWRFARRRTNPDRFVEQLVPLLRARDLARARALAQQNDSSICTVTLAGLLQAEDGLAAVQQGLETATSYERIHLEDKLSLLHEIGRIALLIGVLGTLCDVVAVSAPVGTAPNVVVATGLLSHPSLISAITPIIGGLLVAIPAWLARSMLNAQVQRILRECEFVSRLVSSQLSQMDPITAATASSWKTRRVAA